MASLKFLVFFFFVLALSGAHGQLEGAAKVLADECAKENKVDLPRLIAAIQNGKKIFETHDDMCFGKCIADKLGLVSETGEPQYDMIKLIFNLSDDLVEKVKSCAKNVQGNDQCEKISSVYQCVMDHVVISH